MCFLFGFYGISLVLLTLCHVAVLSTPDVCVLKHWSLLMFTRDFSSKGTMMRKIEDKSYFGVFTQILDKIVISVFFFFSVSPVFSSLQLQNNCLCLGLRKHRGGNIKMLSDRSVPDKA